MLTERRGEKRMFHGEAVSELVPARRPELVFPVQNSIQGIIQEEKRE